MKKVRINENNIRSVSLAQTSNSEMSFGRKKKKQKKKTKLRLLKAEKMKLQKDLKGTEQGILKDSERKASPSYTPYENRQRLARAAFDAVSKLQQVTGEIATKQKEHKYKNDRKLTAKLKKQFMKEEKQQNRLIKMTSKLERLKIDEDELRSEITQELTEGVVNPCLLDAGPDPIRLPPINTDSTDAGCAGFSTSLPEYNGGKNEKDESTPDFSLSESGSQLTQLTGSEKKIVADKLARKYDMTRELRNTIHEHMITRSYGVSYFSIIPPYKQIQPKPQRSKQGFNRMVLENKIGLTDFSKIEQKKLS